MPFNILRALASLDPDFAAAQQRKQLSLELADKESERQRAHDERIAAANLAERKAMTDEQLRLESQREEKQLKTMQNFLVQTYVAQGMPIDTAYNKASVDVAKFKSLQELQAPEATLRAGMASSNLARERAEGAAPYANAAAGMAEQAAAVDAMAKRDASQQKVASTAATEPYVGDLARGQALEEIAKAKAGEARAGLDSEASQGAAPFARAIATFKGIRERGMAGYGAENVGDEQTLESLKRGAEAAKAQAVIENPTLGFPAVLSAQTRADATREYNQLRFGGGGGGASLFGEGGGGKPQGSSKSIPIADLKARVAAKSAPMPATNAVSSLKSPLKVMQYLYKNSTTPYPFFKEPTIE